MGAAGSPSMIVCVSDPETEARAEVASSGSGRSRSIARCRRLRSNDLTYPLLIRLATVKLTADEATEYGGWKKLGIALGHFSDIVAQNERDGYFVVGLLATCPSMPGLVAGLQHSGPTREPIKIGMLWLDAHPDFNTPETTFRRSRADRSEGCPSRLLPDELCNGCEWMRIWIRPWQIVTL